MLKKALYLLVLGLITLGLVGCANTTEEVKEVVEDVENITQDNSKKETALEEKEVIELKTLGLFGLEFEEPEDLESEYPKEVTEGDLKFTAEYLDEDFMSNYSIRLSVLPVEDSEKVEYVRPGMKAYGLEQATVDGKLWYKVKYKGLEGWGLAEHFIPFRGDKVSGRLNNFGSPFGTEMRAPYSVFIGSDSNSYDLFEINEENVNSFGKAMSKEDDYFYVWGGTKEFDMYDMKNTHFVLNENSLKGLDTSEEITITDGTGGIYYYEKIKEYEVDDKGIGIEDGVDYWEEIVGEGEEERVTFQITDDFKNSKIVVFVPIYNLDK